MKRQITPATGPGIHLLSALLPSLEDFAALFPVFFLIARMGGPSALLGDGDTGWHIRTGEWILAQGHVPHRDIFSFTRPGEPWYAWEWLSDILMGWLHSTGGMSAVLIGAMALLCLTFGLLYRLTLSKCGNVMIAFSLTALAAAGSSIHWLARPHLFTMFFLVVFYALLEQHRTKLLPALPFISILWTNLHGGFLIGILLVAGYAAGEMAGALMAKSAEQRNLAAKRSGQYALTALGCLAASFVNPYTWHLHEHLIRYLGDPAYFQNIAEFTSISFRHPLAPFFELMLILGIATAFLNLTKGRTTPFVLLAGCAHLALVSTRNIPLFMIVAAPQVGRSAAEWLGHAQVATGGPVQRLCVLADRISGRFTAGDTGRHWHVFPAAVLFGLGALMIGNPSSPVLRSEYNPVLYPAAALASLNSDDRIFSNDTWGGYLIYRRFPAKVFIDGRSDFYGPGFEREYSELVNARFNWEARLNQYSIDTVVLPVDAPFCSVLKGSLAWLAAYDDHVTIVFRRRAKTNRGPHQLNAAAPMTNTETESHQLSGYAKAMVTGLPLNLTKHSD